MKTMRKVWQFIYGQPENPYLQQPLINFGPKEPYTRGQSFEGLAAFGATGSGKTSTTGRLVIEQMLRAGYSGFGTTTKADDIDWWKDRFRAANRLSDLRVIGPGYPFRINLLDYTARAGYREEAAERVTRCLETLLEASSNSGSGHGGEFDSFWRHKQTQTIKNLVQIAWIGLGQVSVSILYELLMSAPMSPQQCRDPGWTEKSELNLTMREASAKCESPTEERDLRLACDFFTNEWVYLAEKTRSIIVSSVTGVLDCLNRGVMYELFGRDTNCRPEDIEDGFSYVAELPVKKFEDRGRLAQIALKHIFQRYMEREPGGGSRFIFCDEASNFVVQDDALFASTCRSSSCAMIYLCQNLPLYYKALGGGERGRAAAMGLIGNLGTKVFHANSCVDTNQYASDLIGRCKQLYGGFSSSVQDEWTSWDGPKTQSTASFNENLAYKLEPAAFTTLAKGGKPNRFMCSAVLFQNGRIFKSTNDNYLVSWFNQRS